jgi:hypothetical protein
MADAPPPEKLLQTRDDGLHRLDRNLLRFQQAHQGVDASGVVRTEGDDAPVEGRFGQLGADGVLKRFGERLRGGDFEGALPERSAQLVRAALARKRAFVQNQHAVGELFHQFHLVRAE